MADDKNPWGQPSKPTASSKPNRGSGGGGQRPPEPDLDEMLRQLQDKLGSGWPAQGNVLVLALIVVAVLWLASGIYRVNPGEYAVIQRFGEHHRTQVVEGLGYAIPTPVEAVTILNVLELRKLEIGFREFGSRRGNQRSDIREESLMLTSDANIVDLDLVVLWNISNAENYLFNIRDVENTIKKVAESAIREAVGQTPLDPIITTGRESVAKRAQAIMQTNLDDYQSGINIRQVLIQDATVHPDVISAFEDVVAARQDAETFQNEATIYANDIIPKARGEAIKLVQEAEAYKQAEIARATGDAGRFKDIYRAYVKGRDVTKERIYIETMEKVLSNAQSKIILDQESGSSGVVPYLPLNQLKTSGGN